MTYKEATKIFKEELISTLTANLKETVVYLPRIPTDCGMVENTPSVAYFELSCCPGWTFGIWWDTEWETEPSEKDPLLGDLYPEEMSGKFFAQYTDGPYASTLSPYNSQFVGHAYAWKGERSEEIGASVIASLKVVLFIHSEPALAFCRDVFGYDYNEEYLTREEAEVIMRKKVERDAHEQAVWDNVSAIFLKFVNEKVLPMFRDATLRDSGLGFFPRYEIMVPYEENQDAFQEPGIYDLFAGPDGLPISQELADLEKEWDELMDRLAEECAHEDVYGFQRACMEKSLAVRPRWEIGLGE